LELLAGCLLIVLLGGLPLLTRSGLALLVLSSGLLWLLWSLATPTAPIDKITTWLLIILGLAVLATGVSPVPIAATKGLLKLLSYLGVYALIHKLLIHHKHWWDRLLAGLLCGGLVSSVLALRQLYASSEELASWADPNSMSASTIRIYGPLGNPNLLAGYLLPLLPFAAIALLRWKGFGYRLFAGVTLVLTTVAIIFTYSRGGWLGLIAGLSVVVLLLLVRSTQTWPLIWRRLLPPAVLLLGVVVLVVAATQFEPIPHKNQQSCRLVGGTAPTISASTFGLLPLKLCATTPGWASVLAMPPSTVFIRCINNPSSTPSAPIPSP
jgi:putative inorganic carbon (HCO3(-)) transporter